jgi:hypothetical protein
MVNTYEQGLEDMSGKIKNNLAILKEIKQQEKIFESK